MNHNQSSSMSKFLLSLYNCAYELEYSYVYIMFIVYELVLSSCAMFLIYSSLFYIVHLTYMNRSRIRDEMMVHWAFPVALNLAYHSEGLGPAGVKCCFQIREHGVQVFGDQWICGYPTGKGVGGRVVTALSSFIFPHVRIFGRSHVKSLFACRPAMGISLSSQT